MDRQELRPVGLGPYEETAVRLLTLWGMRTVSQIVVLPKDLHNRRLSMELARQEAG